MFEKILSMVKGRVMDSVEGMDGIPEEKKQQTVETTTSTLMDGLKSYATGDNISSIMSMLGGGKGSSAAQSSMTTGLQDKVVSALTSKVGLNQGVASTIASTVIPAIMSLFKKKAADENEPEFNIQSIIGGLTGKSSGGNAGGLMETVGHLFNK